MVEAKEHNCTYDENKRPSYCQVCHKCNSPICESCGKEFYNSISSAHCVDCDRAIYGAWD